jgi:hypothetical protein
MDGWSVPGSEKLFDSLAELDHQAQEVSIETPVEKDLPPEILSRLIVIEFAPGAVMFDAIIPEGYSINGRFVPLTNLGEEYL